MVHAPTLHLKTLKPPTALLMAETPRANPVDPVPLFNTGFGCMSASWTLKGTLHPDHLSRGALVERLAGQVPKEQPVKDRTGEGDQNPCGSGSVQCWSF